MKTISIVRAAVLALLVAGLAACGSSNSGGGSPPPSGSSNWDQMVWDQDNWA